MFTKRFKLFTLFGFDVRIDLSWFIIVILITWTLRMQFKGYYPDLAVATHWSMGLAGALALFVSVLLHEFGHSVVARSYGVPMKGITLFIFGGVAEMDREPQSAKVEFLVAVAGPIVTVFIAAASWGLYWFGGIGGWPDPLMGVLFFLAWINSVVLIFNLMPAFPLDGGRVLRSILWQLKGSLRWATRITSAIGAGFGMFLILMGVLLAVTTGNLLGGIWLFLIGMFMRGAAQMSYQQVLLRRALEGEPISRFMHTDVRTVPPSMTVEQLVEDYVYKHHHKLYPVTEGDRLLGCVTLSDIKNVPRSERAARTVGEILRESSEQNTISPDTDAMEVMSKMSGRRSSRWMVAEDGQLRGIVTLKDMMEFMSLKIELEEQGRSPDQVSREQLPRQESRRDESESMKV